MNYANDMIPDIGAAIDLMETIDKVSREDELNAVDSDVFDFDDKGEDFKFPTD
jgi:hypothetical protein